jgi:hypothetical protein
MGMDASLAFRKASQNSRAAARLANVSARLDQTGIEGTRPCHGREHARLCPGQQSDKPVPHALAQNRTSSAARGTDAGARTWRACIPELPAIAPPPNKGVSPLLDLANRQSLWFFPCPCWDAFCVTDVD